MRYCTAAVLLALLTCLPALLSAQPEYPDEKPPVVKSYTGFSWGMVHTIWNGRWNNEGYPRAGTMGLQLGLRKISPMGSNMALAPYVNYSIMYSRVSELSDSTPSGTVSLRTYFREIDLGINLQASVFKKCPGWYIGGGPSVRWGQAGKRVGHEVRPGTVRKATWFGLTALMGYRQEWKNHAVFIEPQYTFSPDMADRWQRNYPPDMVSLQMGVLW